MGRGTAAVFVLLLMALAVLGGGPASAIFTGWLLGTHTIVYSPGRPDGYTAISGPNAPRPKWIPILPGATIVGAHQVVAGRTDGFGMVDLVTRLPLDEVKAFYTRSLTDLGFKVRDDGLGNLNSAAAQYLGFAGHLIAEHPGDGPDGYRSVVVQLRTEEGWLVRSRLIGVQWRRQIAAAPIARAPSQGGDGTR